ncbi:ABC transporter substrate-binding protein [Bordetella petrii]|uniref:Probable ABC transporter, periplasmic binding protein n=1 Tax=Bordetella petrii (strain ATCC BAA-461 / DSM 12804 / CCUG 43448 / CIP 107267 / Se-1111R) TaxID=340100 RepID=A9HXX0_BORPD|nr:ABC transporter substrate-binding protein [Bordetella petrii]CAP40614.1 probable ABC transporter, periplasmic binding protein [Bordetella petrii]
MKKNRLLTAFAATALAAACVIAPAAAQAEGKTLRIVPHADLKVLDPTFTTAYITRNFGYMVYDTLFAMDAKGEPQPQMVDSYKASEDKKTWTFVLRDGLKFSDGQPVKAADCVASLQRWTARDNIGRALTAAGGKWQAVDDKTFTLTLERPFGLVLDGLAKVSSYPAFILPERLAKMPADRPLTEVVGSGPYLFKRDEWLPGSKVVFVRNPDYVARSEAPSGLAGSKRSHVDRVEWVVLPDSNSAVAALKNKEVDMIEQTPPDYIEPLRAEAGIKVGVIEQNQAYMVLNQALPPFNNIKARQAVAHMIDQAKFVAAMGYPPDLRRDYCATFFICGSTNDTDAGSKPYAKPDLAAAKQALGESGYKGEKIVVMLPTTPTYLNSATLVAVQALQELGMNLDIQSMDWASMTARRSKKSPLDQGGWNVFLSSASEFNVNSPLNNTYLAATCGNTLPGWPCDKELDELRVQWIAAVDPAERKQLLDRFQERAYQAFPNIPVGQFSRTYSADKSLKNLDLAWSVPNVWVLDK